jgi:hypothetical protein
MLIRKIHRYELKTCIFSKMAGKLSGKELSLHNREAHLSMLLKDGKESNVKIVFNTVDGYREVISSIWGSTEKYLFLQGGDFVPIDSVAKVTLE